MAKEIKKEKMTFLDKMQIQADAEEYTKYEGDFKKDLFEHFKVSGKKAEKAFDIAWDHQHSYGLYEVYQEFEDLVSLIK